MAILFANNAQTTLAGAITNIATTANLQAGSGVLFPAPTGSDFFVGTFVDAATGLLREIVHVTNVTGDTITMVRGQEGTTAQAWNAGDTFALFVTAGDLSAMVQTTQLQAGAANYAVDSGSANAYVAAFTPAITAHVAGMQIRVKIANANTAPSTLNVGAGAASIVQPNGSPIGANALTVGMIAVFEDDGTNYQLVGASASAGGIPGAVRNLVGNSTGNQTATWTADALVSNTALNGSGYLGTNLTFNFNGATTGTNGMDIGAMPTSGDLSVYAIYNPTTQTWACLGTITGHGPIYSGGNMPSGYTASALIWVGRTDASAHFLTFTQVDRVVSIRTANAISGASSTTVTPVSLSSIVPAAARSVAGFLTAPSAQQINVYSDSTQLGMEETGNTSGQASSSFGPLIMKTAQTIYYNVNGGTNGIITISGYSF